MNPTILSPTSRFAPPHRNGTLRSPSRSPKRQQFVMSHELDPLLSNLSPTSTLEALGATRAVNTEGETGQSVLRDSVAAASTSERALGIRAALAGKKLKEWHRELTAWPWPGSLSSSRNAFLMPSEEEQKRFKTKLDHNGHIDGAFPNHGLEKDEDDPQGVEYWGGLPARLAQDYEVRIDLIRDDMEALEVEDLKDYVRDAHLTSNSRRLSRGMYGNGPSSAEYIHLDDFTAVITATIMHALPIISRLNSLLGAWSVRLAILRQIPEFLKLLEYTRTSLAVAWHLISDIDFAFPGSSLEHTRTALYSKRVGLENGICELGRRLDTMLDLLEGREDTIPEEWIDGMESIEAEFGSWVVETEKILMEAEWKLDQISRELTSSKEQESQDNLSKTGSVSFVREESYNSIIETKWMLEKVESDLKTQLGISVLGQPDPFGSDGQVDSKAAYIIENLNSDMELKTFDLGFGPSNSSISEPQCGKNSPPASSARLPELSLHERGVEDHDRELSTQKMDEKKNNSLSSTTPPAGLNKFSLSSTISTTALESFSLIQGSEIIEAFNNKIKSSPSLEPTLEVNTASEAQSEAIQEGAAYNKDATTAKLDSLSSIMPEPIATPVTDFLLITPDAHALQDRNGKRATTPRPAPLILKKSMANAESTTCSDISSDTSIPGSGTSEYFSNMSSPEIQYASMAEYFENPVEVETPLRGSSTPLSLMSRRSSLFTERDENGVHENRCLPSFALSMNGRRRASSFAPESSIPESTGVVDELPVHRENVKSHVRVRSASLRSFEVIPRHEIRNVTIRRSGSYSSAILTDLSLQVEERGAEKTPTVEYAHSEKQLRADIEVEKLKSWRGESKDQLQSEFVSDTENASKIIEKTSSTSLRPSGPIKSRHRFENVTDFSPDSTPVKLRRRKTAHPSAVNANAQKETVSPPRSFKNSEDQLEARISYILTELPGHIRLKSGPEPDAPDVLPSDAFSDHKKVTSGSPALRLKRPQASASSSPLTLTPANLKASRSRTLTGDPEIKLYHLHQSGKDVPIKLFVRLVGEAGERVMVRIGGGWADLGEYLKEYASHHGRRSVSDGRFEIQGLPQAQPSTPISTLAGISSPAVSPASRPNSPSTRASSSLAFRHARHSACSSADVDAPMTPENPVSRYFESTLGSTDPSMLVLRPSSRLSSTADDDSPLGLAGPKARKKEVSPSKQAWVDGMLDQARHFSAEKNKGGGDRDFGDLGKVGNTKRVFLKSRRDA